MYSLFLICATIGGTILLLQVVLSVLGLGFETADADMDLDLSDGHSSLAALGKVLTLQTILAFLTFFGVGGLVSLESGWGASSSVLVASGTGFVAMLVLGYAFQGLRKLQSDGTVQLSQALGQPGRVYLRIPADNAGFGKVTVTLQGRTVEVPAKTAGRELRTGEHVVVTAVRDDRSVEVVAAESYLAKPAALL